jgi:serine/threonine protein kinase
MEKEQALEHTFRSRSWVSPPYRGRVAEAYSAPEFLSVLADPVRLMAGPGTEVLLESRNRVVSAKINAGPKGERSVVVKQYYSRGINRIKSFGQPSRAERAWRGAIALLEAGLATPLPVAFAEKRAAGFVSTSFFISERVADGLEIRSLLRDLPDERLKPMLADLVRGLARLHAAGILHRDLSDGNILVRKSSAADNFEFYLLDTNRVRCGRRLAGMARAKNLIRLGVPSRLQAFFLESYAQAAGRPLRKSFVLWYQWTKSAFSTWIRVKKALWLRKIARKLRIQ